MRSSLFTKLALAAAATAITLSPALADWRGKPQHSYGHNGKGVHHHAGKHKHAGKHVHNRWSWKSGHRHHWKPHFYTWKYGNKHHRGW